MSIKINSLTETTATANDDYVVVDNGSKTKKMKAKTFQQEVKTDLQTELDKKVNIADIIDALTDTSTNKPLSANQGKILKELADKKINIADIIDNLTSTDTNKPLSANQGKELDTKKTNVTDIVDNLTSTATNKPLSANQGKVLEDKKVNTTDIVDNLTSTDTDKPLSANQGKRLKDLIDSKGFKVYGFKREIANSNYSTRITYTDDAVGLTPVTIDLTNQTQDMGSWANVILELARPVMLKSDGTVDYELNHDDTTKKLDGTDSDISNTDYDGNAMVEFRNYKYVSRKTVDGYQYVRFATYKVDETFEDNAFINESGDSVDSFFWSMFEGSLDSSNVLRSLADLAVMVSKNASTEMTYAKNNGTGWNTVAWTQLNYIWDWLTLLGKTDGLQETYGNGVSSVSAAVATGQTKAKGCFFGQSGGANSVRTLWIENLWGNTWTRCAGMINDNGTYKVKLTGPYPTPTDTASTYSDYINTGLSTPDNGYVKEANCSENGFLPTAAGGSASTYFCDYFYKNDSGVKYVFVGGSWDFGSFCGRCVYVNLAASTVYAYVGSRLLKV